MSKYDICSVSITTNKRYIYNRVGKYTENNLDFMNKTFSRSYNLRINHGIFAIIQFAVVYPKSNVRRCISSIIIDMWKWTLTGPVRVDSLWELGMKFLVKVLCLVNEIRLKREICLCLNVIVGQKMQFGMAQTLRLLLRFTAFFFSYFLIYPNGKKYYNLSKYKTKTKRCILTKTI